MATIKTQVEQSITISDFHKAVFQATETGRKAGETLSAKLAGLLTSKYGEHMPNVKQYDDDQLALKALSEQKGLKDNQYARKAYASAVKLQYGALPVSMVESAVQKRAERLNSLSASAQATYQANIQRELERGKSDMEATAIALEAVKSAKADSGRPQGGQTGQVREVKASQAESLEQWITRVGIVNVLDACNKILAGDKSTTTQAKTLAALAAGLAGKLDAKKAA